MKKPSPQALPSPPRPSGLARAVLPDALAFACLAAVHQAWGLVNSVQQGRDFLNYMSYYAQLFLPEPVDHLLMLYRTPGAPLFFGLLDSLGGLALVEAGLCALFAASLTVLARAVRLRWGTAVAVALLAVLCLIPSYNLVWRTVSSESPFCAGVAFLAAAALAAFDRPTPRRWAGLGALCFVLAMIRPSGQLFGLLGLGALFLPGIAARARIKLCGAFLLTFALLCASWAAHNGLRYGQFTVARGGAAIIPAYRLFILERALDPLNGPASQALASAVARDLLPRKEYREKQVDLELFFSAGDSFMFADLVGLSDRAFGWDSGYSTLRYAALEALARNPRQYLAGVRDSLWLVFSSDEFDIFGKVRERWPEPEAATRHKGILGMGKPGLPGEVEILGSSSVYWLSSGSGRFAPDPRTVQAVRAAEQDYLERYPDFFRAVRPGPLAAQAWAALAKASSWFFVVGLAGLLAFTERSPRCQAVRWLYGTSLAMLLATYAGTDTVIQFRNPFDPVFVLAALAGIVAVKGRFSPGRPPRV